MNGIYLFLLLREIENDLVGFHIDDVLVMDRLVQFAGRGQSIYLSLYPEAPALFLSPGRNQGFTRLNQFSALRSCRITRVEQPPFMPVLHLHLTDPRADNPVVIISLYREAPNCILKTASGERRLYRRYIQKEPKKPILALNSLADKDVGQLVREFEGIDKYLAGELKPENLPRLKDILAGARPKPRFVSASPLRISLFAADFKKEYPSFNKLFEEGIASFIQKKTAAATRSRKTAIVRNMKRRIARVEKKLLEEGEIEAYRISGELILSNVKKIERGLERINLFNPYSQKNISIELDPTKTPQQNAQAYFIRYKKQKRGQPLLKVKIKELKKKIEDMHAPTFEAMPKTSTITATAPEEKPLPYRRFSLPSGSVVYVGKGARSNTELTFGSARPDDYFFHVRGYGGAHTILKAKVPKGQRPRREDIEAAASIAAYFSKAKNQKNVPVSYTQRKYLKKNKKGKPGSVILMREEVIFVEPKIIVKSS